MVFFNIAYYAITRERKTETVRLQFHAVELTKSMNKHSIVQYDYYITSDRRF